MTDYRSKKKKSSDKIISFEKFLKNYPEIHTVNIYARSSHYYPKYKQYLQYQIRLLTEEAEKHGRSVNEVFSGIEKRWNIKNRPVLQKAVEESGSVPIFVKDITRLVGYKDKEKLPGKKRIEKLLEEYPNVLFIVLDSPEEIKRNRTIRGQKESENKGGRPAKAGYKKRRKERLQPKAEYLRKYEGMSYREISKKLHVSLKTVWRWLQ